ncbi:ABC transporter ATP-binding protein [Sphingomonas sp. AP4-R1]|uniref:ABC transporter ATP-binding protein n=1 Tax=Sphingomonas sp. AP4-R1 TaxID=2735134 RepID=UPI001493930C|nr:ABC transporter ATP-binding protein [Sphingomonas sp. AP4-R1]QJU57361.1 ABC transporter ATP-binding protein [Sphingomonas sp. AP4-R1]
MTGTIVAELDKVSTAVATRQGQLPVLEEFDLALRQGETVAVVGESGCGKSMAALTLMRLLPRGEVDVSCGAVRVAGRDITTLPDREVARLRGREIAMIFQNPMSALNPVMTIGRQLEEAIAVHDPRPRAALRERALELLRMVAIPDPETRHGEYPHRLSGGMCQRIAIAMAIACSPQLLIADEPTTALDVTIQAQMLQLLQRLKDATGMAMLFITHDLGVVAEMADRVVVMYAGRKVEEANVADLFARPLHPYTQGLMALTLSAGQPRQGRLPEIAGMVPPLGQRPAGCTFAPRCPHAFVRCREQAPPLADHGGGHKVACWRAEQEDDARVTPLRH